jgi:predicted dehydrogenase
MATVTVGVAMNGVSGRMGANQHLARSIMAIRQQGGVPLPDGGTIVPEPILVGRSEDKLAALAARHGLTRWTTDVDGVLGDPDYPVFFDTQVTSARAAVVRRAVDAGKHVYCEKPTAESLADALELARVAAAKGVKTGVVQDKLFLPGLRKLRSLVTSGFFGRVLSVRGDFGYWVFDGEWGTPQRPSWNYRAEDGGSMIGDMFCHWRYVLDHVVAPVRSVSCLGATLLRSRYDENGRPYVPTADDAAVAAFELAAPRAGDPDVLATMNSSWATRPNRDELLEIQVDGTHGSAVAGLWRCRVQPRELTPRAVWNPDVPDANDYRAHWQEMPDTEHYDNGFKVQWEAFLRHVVTDEPFPWDLLEAAKGVQLAELARQSWQERCWVDVPELAR